MFATRLLLASVLFLSGTAFAQTRTPTLKSPLTLPAGVLEQVAPAHRDAVSKVVSKPTLTAKYTEESFSAHSSVYEWLLDHPDRVSLAWQRMNVPCVEILETSGGVFSWTDENGSQLTWQAVAKIPSGVIWYAVGKVKAAMLLPVIPVKAVALVKYARQPTTEPHQETFTPEVTVFLQCDSRAANAVLRLAGPAAPKLAEQGAEQLLFFFSGVATYLQKHPEKVSPLLAPRIAK